MATEDLKYTVERDGDMLKLADSDGLILYSRNENTLYQDYHGRYLYSHYDLCSTPPKKFITCNQHKDNLNNIRVADQSLRRLRNVMPIKLGDVVVEAGAYQGFGTVKISQTVGEAGLVVAIEADPKNYEVLVRNIEANNIKNVIPVNVGVWSEGGKIPLYSKGSQRRSLVKSLLKSEESALIDVNTIDNILDDAGVNNIDFLTLEVNSAEAAALRGLRRRLSGNHPMRIVSAGWYKDSSGVLGASSVISELKKYSFSTFLGVRKRVYAYR